MTEEGKYIYCIIGTNEGRNFGPIGIGGRGDIVSTIGYEDLSAVISNSPLDKYVVNKENLIAHEKVVEEVMKNYTVLPMRFCTVASSAEEVRNLLRKRYLELKNLLKDMDNKIELGVKAFWKEMKVIFQEIVDEDKKIKSLKEKIAKKSLQESYAEGINLGKIVKTALELKREKEGQGILNVLKRISHHFHLHEIQGDEMLINAVFLVDRAREREFDNQVQELASKYSPRVIFKYIGPTPPYNFINLNLK
ncbi:MAG: GvpL/GvpF family gas vesicle protein [Candidatus Atribacteria bacterium]|nr:GvpL/GvpF family gas vesicle protein [Candidatus Atribacteria bacterium]